MIHIALLQVHEFTAFKDASDRATCIKVRTSTAPGVVLLITLMTLAIAYIFIPGHMLHAAYNVDAGNQLNSQDSQTLKELNMPLLHPLRRKTHPAIKPCLNTFNCVSWYLKLRAISRAIIDTECRFVANEAGFGLPSEDVATRGAVT